MGTERLRIGKQIDGTYGMRATLPGFDTRYDDASDVNKFSFNSEWTDIVRVHKYGYADPPNPLPIWPGDTVPGSWPEPTPGAVDDSNAYFTNNNGWLVAESHSLGYVPFVEARVVDGNTVYDDYRKFSRIAGAGANDFEFNGERAWAFSNVVKINTWSHTVYDGSKFVRYGCRVGFIIYEIPVDA